MAKEPAAVPANTFDNRESWLREATRLMRPMFDAASLPLPESIRFAIAFTSSGRKGKSLGETWHSPASADGAYEIMIRADLAEPVEILIVLCRQLIHAALPLGDTHGKQYKAAAQRIGLEGKMRDGQPTPLLQERLHAFATTLPPLPHARLDIHWKAIDRPKKQPTRMLKAECKHVDESKEEPCGYTIRLASKWARLGARCPIHGDMTVDAAATEENPDMNGEPSPAADHNHNHV